MTCPQSIGSAISIVPQGTAELQRQISSLREKDSHPSLHSFNFLCRHRRAYVMGERNALPFSAEFIQAGPTRNSSSSTPQRPLPTPFLLRAPWTKYGQRRLSPIEESQFNYKIPCPIARENYLKMAPSVHMLENSRGSAEPRVTLTMAVKSVCDCWVGGYGSCFLDNFLKS